MVAPGVFQPRLFALQGFAGVPDPIESAPHRSWCCPSVEVGSPAAPGLPAHRAGAVHLPAGGGRWGVSPTLLSLNLRVSKNRFEEGNDSSGMGAGARGRNGVKIEW